MLNKPYHYRRQNYFRYLVYACIVILILILFRTFGNGNIILSKYGLLSVPWPDELDFCGEEVPLDDFYVRESWEKEFLVTLASDYQNILYLKRAPKYLPFIESELKNRKLPADLKYIAIAESALREDVRSSAGAMGIWQFIASTAQNYGLRVDEEIDERMDFDKATFAALNYFEFLENKFDSWTLAAAAYNAGENGIQRRLDEQEVETYYDLYLNEETSRYLFRILAIKEIMEHPEKYGYELEEKDYFEWPDFELVSAGAVDNLSTWAIKNNSTLRKVKELNPWIVGKSLPDGVWKIKIPN